jgi:hypothetical protein|tara:strand:- start:2887 stop:3186 length:300 start_codon:yes stop_codon:yes gene_type:complete
MSRMESPIGLRVARPGTTGLTVCARTARFLTGNMRTGLSPVVAAPNVKYLITYEKRGRHGLFPATSADTIEAKDMIDATMKALINANKNERVKSVALIA